MFDISVNPLGVEYSLSNISIFSHMLHKISLKGGSVMKKIVTIFLVLLGLFLNAMIMPTVLADNLFNEGVYKSEDFNFSPNNAYTIQNVSSTDSVYIILFDENQLGIQAMRLEPKSGKYNLLPLKPDYRIVIVGNGQVYIS